MITTRKHLIAVALLASVGLGAIAQTAPAPANPPAEGRYHHRMDPAKMQERFTQRMADLKQKLQLTAAQEPAWTSFTNGMRPTGTMQRIDREALSKLSTPDRIDQMRALRNQRMAEMDRRGEATKAFYNALTPDQKKVFDAETSRRGHRGGHHGRHGGMHS